MTSSINVTKHASKFLTSATSWTRSQIRKFLKDKKTQEDEKVFAPLRGLRVLDLTRVLAGPYCTMILGDLGAEIIKVEKPVTGDDTRNWGPPWISSESAYFLSINRNKKSICVDIQKQEGAQVIRQLSSISDVVIENFVPGKLSQYGLGYEHLRTVNSKLIYVSITGFGPTGPYSQRGGYDNVAAAIGGLMHITGPENGEPCRPGVAVTDLQTGLYATSAILASLLHRNESNSGRHINCNLLNTNIASLTHVAASFLNCGLDGFRMGTGHPSIVPYQAFMTSDGKYVMIGAGNDKQFAELCRKLGVPELILDDRYVHNMGRVANRGTLIATLSKIFLSKTRDEWSKELEEVDFPFGPINNLQEVFSDPQVIHNQIIQEIDHPTVGKIKIPGPAVQYEDAKLGLQNPPPSLGQHTDEILSRLLNYNTVDIEELRSSGAIQ